MDKKFSGIVKLDLTTTQDAIREVVSSVKLSGKQYSRIVTTGRGGLALAQALAYALNVPVSTSTRAIKPTDLFVDDIVCTGKTISKLECDVATLVFRKGARKKPKYFSLTVTDDRYVEFYWEKI